MFIAKNNDLIILVKETKEELEQALQFMNYTSIEETDVNYTLHNGQYLTEEEFEQQEKARIQELFMTRSDFFDATIRAFGADEDDLLTAIGGVLVPMGIDNVEAKIALNNYKNALNFYRKHPLFTMLSNVNIPISAEVVINITSDQWDRFFDETSKKNPEAYKELLPNENNQD